MKKLFIVFIGILCFYNGYSQGAKAEKTIYAHSDTYGYGKYKIGKYTTKSTLARFFEGAGIINGVTQIKDTSLLSSGKCGFIGNQKPIVLFNTMNPQTEKDVAGILLSGSLILCDTVFYNSIYTEDPENSLLFTWDVWYALTINEKTYYTDYKIHDYRAYKVFLPGKKQIFTIFAESTGYDDIYDVGYPDNFRVVVFEKTKNSPYWKQIYCSQSLDLNSGGYEEFWDSDYFPHTIDANGNLTIIFMKDGEDYPLIWDGKDLILE